MNSNTNLREYREIKCEYCNKSFTIYTFPDFYVRCVCKNCSDDIKRRDKLDKINSTNNDNVYIVLLINWNTPYGSRICEVNCAFTNESDAEDYTNKMNKDVDPDGSCTYCYIERKMY